ncbi:PIN domain-containing protein [Burkholderia cenocepacia]|uniref:PIN domain-containing protein n=1 Tax=Burkholderia cenocepacia TaxID=95486 RepID=UPI002232837D|nr:PIN domain-containing protein [Burkholderia cenocepacia]MCW3656922.1 PIN domain-containing protein [Burkholderia cenocepacia]MDI9680268.1 PIN domain-containing protein [Burkholderia cenocepacia]MDS0804741.1 PIN domain-containing protein [Burkholderia cenocepacia]
MLHVILDTNIYRDDPKRQKLPFKALERLLVEKVVTLHVPYIIEREFQTQQRKKYGDTLRSVLAGLKELSNFPPSAIPAALQKIPAWIKELDETQEAVLADAEGEIVQWFKKVGAQRIPLSADQATSAFEAYFKGTAPFKEAKVRSDIPDSFIARAVERAASEAKEVHFVVHDKKLREAFNQESIVTYEDLSQFIESPLIQAKLLDLDVLDNAAHIRAAVQKFEEETGVIRHAVESKVGESIMWKKIDGAAPLDDEGHATINGYGDVTDLELHWPDFAFFGDGEFGIPFSLEMTVQAYYYIFKADYYAHFGNRRGPSVTDHNDHYYEAEDEFSIVVKGTVGVSVFKDKLKDLENFAFVNEASIHIVDIDNIEPEDDN